MERKDYSKFITHALYDMDLRRIQMTDLYQTKYYIHTEYTVLFSETNCQTYHLLKDLSLDRELKFYLYLDMLTYLPFEKLGYDYLNKKLEKENSNVIEFKYNQIIKLLNHSNMNIDDEINENIKTFLNNYYDDIFEINIINLAIISLRLFHRFITIMNFGTFVGGSMGIHKKIDKILDEITNDVNTKELKEININDYLPEFDYSNKLDDAMIEYLQLCLDREIIK